MQAISQPVSSLYEGATKLTRGHSCVSCQRRKVKCDKQKPCSNCTKTRIDCVQSTPLRRRRKKTSESDLAAKLRKYEHLLKKHGIDIDEDDDDPLESSTATTLSQTHHINQKLSLEVPRNPSDERGMFINEKGNSRYVESTLWENLRDEIQDPRDAHTSSSDDEINETDLYPQPERLLICYGAGFKELGNLHPQPILIFRLWQTFLVNVDPLVKIFHAPTIQQTVLDASTNLRNIPKHVEALLFSIYFIAVTSMQPNECESLLGSSKPDLLVKYSHGAQQALVNARFMRSLNLTTLNAFIIYLLASRTIYDPHSFWLLTGSALRIAQRLGIHRDKEDGRITPFEAEMRRRTWWQIRFLDGQVSKLVGAGFPAWLASFDSRPPLNISDSDLSPNMTEAPVEREGATEMLFCSLRYEVAEFLKNSGQLKVEEGEIKFETSLGLIENKDKQINAFENLLHEKFIRHCAPSIPLHLLTIYVAKSVICTMRLMAHHPRQYPDKGASMPQSEKDMILEECLKELEISAFGKQEKAAQGFLWHIQVHFQLDAFIYVLSELRNRTTGDQVERAWEQVEVAYDQRPEMLTEVKNSLYFAIGNLALKAWSKREEQKISYKVPGFISILRSQRGIPETPDPVLTTESYGLPAPYIADPFSPGSCYTGGHYGDLYQSIQGQRNHSPHAPFDVSMPDLAASDWEYFQTMLDGELPAYTGHDIGQLGQDWRF